MALTDSSSLFGSIHEDGFNRILRHVMRKRPSLFNYGTQWVADEWQERLCFPPEVDELVLDPTNEQGAESIPNPVVTVENPLPILGTDGAYGLNFAAQILDLAVDFHPSDLDLPPELGSKLEPQRFALTARACGGIGCPHPRVLDVYPPPRPARAGSRRDDVGPVVPGRETIPLPTEGLTCFCLDLFIVGHFEVTGPPKFEFVEMKLDGLELVDVEPLGLEGNIECYLRMLAHFVLLPRLRFALKVCTFDLFDDFPKISLQATTNVPHNPAVEDDQIKVFADLVVVP